MSLLAFVVDWSHVLAVAGWWAMALVLLVGFMYAMAQDNR